MKSSSSFRIPVVLLLLALAGLCQGNPRAVPRRVAQPQVVNRVIDTRISSTASEEELRNWPVFSEPLLPITGTDDPADRRALAAALNAWSVRPVTDDHSTLRAFVTAHPDSRWVPSLRLNLGILSYEGAWFSRALDDWRLAWEQARSSTTPEGIAVANGSVSRYFGMLARVGRMDDLQQALRSVRARTFQGADLQRFVAAHESAHIMRTNPGVSFRCGPFALASIQEKLNGKPDIAFLHDIQSPVGGFSVKQVREMAAKGGMSMVAARRTPGAPVIVPSVVHWKLDHYAALVEENNGRYLLKDPTFTTSHWISKEALDHEASGAFLVPSGNLPSGWAPLSEADAESLHGKGFTNCVANNVGPGTSQPFAPPVYDSNSCSSMGGGSNAGTSPGGTTCGMPSYSLMNIPCALVIEDVPVLYRAAFGPSLPFRLAYNQRAIDQPATMLFSNFGPLWSGEFTAYLEDDPGNLNANITIHLRNGGYDIATWNTGTGAFNTDLANNTQLVRTAPGVYERRFKDGSKEVYGQAIGTTGPNRKVFLTQIVDATGRALTLTYDPVLTKRVMQVIDASGLVSQFSYEYPGLSYLITRITDPFGREAQFTYTSFGGTRRLTAIRDAVGLQSSFTYDASGAITSMTTPYGKTTFIFNSQANYPSSGAEVRFVEVTDPAGLKERIEFRTQDTFFNIPAAEAAIPSAAGLNITNDYNYYRNVFYWDHKAMRILGGSVTNNPAASLANATVFHYLHVGSAASGVIESIKRPLQSRVYYNYPGQTQPIYAGTSSIWSAEARLVENPSGGPPVTQITKRESNSQGNITKVIDPVGRETVYEYDTNGIDLRFTKQKINGVSTVIQEIQYNAAFPPHLPWKVIDAAGQATTFAYNTRGQVTSVTNALNEVTTFAYEENSSAPDFGKLKTITGALPGAATTFTYDVAQHVRTVTDSAGYTLTYDYDDLDRPTKITYPDGTFEQTTYDRLDPGTQRDRMGRITQLKYNAIRQLITSIDPAQRVLQFDYCSCGAMKLLVDGNGNQTKWDFDVLGRVITKRYADNRGDDYAYEPLSGRLSTITDAKGQIKKFTYNLDGTLKKLDYQNEQIATPDVTYTYDANFNRLATMLDGIGTHTYSYYPPGVLGALQVQTQDGPFTDPVPLTDLITYTYDALGRVKTRNIGPTGTENKITWGYDALGRVISEVNNLCPQTPAPTQFSYNYVGTTGRLASVDYPNGQRTLYDYWPAVTAGQPGNSDFRLKQIANFGQGTDPATLLSRFDYTYDLAGNIATWGRKLGAAATEQTYTFGYDEADQLTRGILAETANPNSIFYRYYATFDKAGNRLSKQEDNTLTSYTYNNLNQVLTSQGGGNLVVAGRTDEPVSSVNINGVQAKLLTANKWEGVVPLSAGNNTLTVMATDLAQPANTRTKSWTVSNNTEAPGEFAYDFNGNTTSLQSRDFTWNANDQMATVAEGISRFNYRFDGFGRRVEKLDANGSLLARWIWSGMTICEEISNSGTMQKFQHGAAKAQTNSFFTFDHLDSLREGISNAGVLQRRWDYSLNGVRVEVAAVGGFEVPFGFTGHFHDNTDLIIAPFRPYPGYLSRWLSRDPLNEADGVNLYAYVRNDPINKRDPLGLEGSKHDTLNKCIDRARQRRDQCVSRTWIPGVGTVFGAIVSVGMKNPVPVVCGYGADVSYANLKCESKYSDQYTECRWQSLERRSEQVAKPLPDYRDRGTGNGVRLE